MQMMGPVVFNKLNEKILYCGDLLSKYICLGSDQRASVHGSDIADKIG